MAASLNLPPRQTQDAFAALASDKLPARDRVLIIGMLAMASWAIVGFCVTLAGL